MNKYTVEVDGKVFDFYQDTPPTDDEILSAANGGGLQVDVYAEQPKEEAQPEDHPQAVDCDYRSAVRGGPHRRHHHRRQPAR